MSLKQLPNLGPTIIRRLHEISVTKRSDLARLGAPEIYRRLSEIAGRALPVCYYLYSLEGARRGLDWRDLTDREKDELRRKAGLA